MEHVVPKLKIGGRIIFFSPDFKVQSTGKFSFERTANDTCIITRLK